MARGYESVTIFHSMERLERSQLSSVSSVRELYVINSGWLPLQIQGKQAEPVPQKAMGGAHQI